MEVLRRAANPWGQEVILGVGWDLFWAAVVAGFAFVIVHTLMIMRLRKAGEVEETPAWNASGERVTRHNLASRVFHWTMAASMFALLITAFFPVMGIDFDWVTIHWIAGLVLIASVIYHIFHSVFFQSLMSVWVGPRDVKEGLKEFSHLVGGKPGGTEKAGKYPVGNKLYHQRAAVATLVAIVTGLYMMVRIENPVFSQNQYMLSDDAWGWVYLLHGGFGVMLVLMTISHVYFAVRPEKRWQTRSMFKGWITREEYLKHHDPDRWAVEGIEGSGGSDEVEGGAMPPAVEQGV